MNKKESPQVKIPIVSRNGNVFTFAGATRKINLGNILKHARIQQGLSQEELAGLFGVTRYTIMNWEASRNKPDLSLVPKLCSVLNISVSDLFGMKSELSKAEQSFIQNLRRLKPSTQRTVSIIVKSLADNELDAHDEMLLNTTRIIDEYQEAFDADSSNSGIDFVE